MRQHVFRFIAGGMAQEVVWFQDFESQVLARFVCQFDDAVRSDRRRECIIGWQKHGSSDGK